MAATPVTLEIRWRRSGNNAAWTTRSFPAGPTSVRLDGVSREAAYEVQARYIGDNGVPSAWVPVAVTVAAGRQGAAAYPPSLFGNAGSIWVAGTLVNYSATPTSATITVSAGTLQVADQQVSYGASSATVAGTAGQTSTYYLYYDDPLLQGGARTLGVAGDRVTASAEAGRIFITDLQITFPTSGTSSGGGDAGGGGGGSGGSCVACEAWVIRRTAEGAEVVQAGEVVIGDWLRIVDPVTGAERWGLVTMSHAAMAERVRVTTESGTALTCSTTAPLGTVAGPVLAPDAAGHRLAERVHGVFGHGLAAVEPAEPGLVQHITCENDYFLAGDTPWALLAHHNLKNNQSQEPQVMAYTKRPDIAVADGWLAVELDTGALVAVTCERKRVDRGVSYHARARVIEADGTDRLDAHGDPIEAGFKHNAGMAQLAEHGDAVIAADALRAVLGEPPEALAWPAPWLAEASIRLALDAAETLGPADPGDLL